MSDDILSGEQVRLLLHISKRRAAWMLQNGYIPCTDTGKRTRRYSVRRSDFERFMEDFQTHPERFHTPVGLFSAANPHSEDDLPRELPPEFRPWLEARFWRYHLALTMAEVADITGYNINTIHRWVKNGTLRSAKIQGDVVIPKAWLIDFYCSTGYRMPGMCKKHKRLLKRFWEGK